MSRSNKLFLLVWLPRIHIVTNLGKIMVNFFFFNFSESKVFLPLKTMFRYGLLEYSNHFNWFLGSVGDFEDDV